MYIYIYTHKSGWWPLQHKSSWWLNHYVSTHLKNMSSSIGMMTFPIYGKTRNVPNHHQK